MIKNTVQKLVDAEKELLEAVGQIKENVIELILASTKPPVVIPDNESVPLRQDLVRKLESENDGWGDTITFLANQNTGTVKDKVVVCGGRSGILNHKNQDVPFIAYFSNLTFVQGQYKTGWGIQLNNAGGVIEDCTFVRLGEGSLTESKGHKDGHPVYIHLNGKVELIGNKFIDCEGNVQFAARPWEKNMITYGEIVADSNLFNNCSHSSLGHGGGGAANLAIYAASIDGTRVEVTNNVVNNTISYPGSHLEDTYPCARGFLTVWNECWYPKQNHIEAGYLPDDGQNFSNVYVGGNEITTSLPDRPLIQVQGAKEIVIEDNLLELVGPEAPKYPIIRIDHDLNNPVKADKIKIDPIDAPGMIQIGREVYPLSEGYESV